MKISPTVGEAIRVCQAARHSNRVIASLHSNLLNELMQVALDCPEKPEGYELTVQDFSKTKYDNICLTSGGADSTIFWYLTGKPKGLYINMGQEYAEKEIARLKDLGVDFKLVDISGCFNGSMLNDWKHIIPGRNFLFLTIAAEQVQDRGTIFFSVVSGEGWESGKGDKSERFVELWRNWYYKVTGKDVNVETMVSDTKGDWLKTFAKEHDINIIRNQTVTCFSGNSNKQCGKCQACLRKYLSFIHCGIDISDDFNIHPMEGGRSFVDKYKVVLRQALNSQDFTHYSEARCRGDLGAIEAAEVLIGS